MDGTLSPARTPVHALPPGQRRIDGFPRFGAHLARRPPAVPPEPAIEICGAVREPIAMPLARLAALPRREMTADLHCVAGWSATGLRWEGVAFETLYRLIIEPVIPSGSRVTHLVFTGLDGFRSIVTLEDALADNVLIAERLDGQPLDGDHGAPARLVSPDQYGYINTKHLCRIELHTDAPPCDYHPSPIIQLGLRILSPHPRARVWQQERHRHLPNRIVRPIYRRLIAVIRHLSA
jgi:DMSO/TMAO reductase YedYZ molybdopterin-dependent catalytic subunit